MKWSKENECPWECWTFCSAIEIGNLNNLKWLKENGCLWNTHTFQMAARNGNHTVMNWLKENECTLDIVTLWYTENYHSYNQKWFEENGCPHPKKRRQETRI